MQRPTMLRIVDPTNPPSAVRERVMRALGDARAVQPLWASKPLRERLGVIREVRALIAERSQALAGSVWLPHRESAAETLMAEVMPLTQACRFLERAAPKVLAVKRPSAWSAGILSAATAVEVRREPLGLVLVIGPANYPLMLPGIQALQALAAGNAVVIKPGRGGGDGARVLRALLIEAGLPSGLYQVVDESVEAARVAIEVGVDKVLLTGSAQTGRGVLRQLSSKLTPATMELSGSDAVFVLDDADLTMVSRALRFGLLFNGSATCIAPRRVFVARSRAAALEQGLLDVLASAKPLTVPPPVAAQVRALLEDALAKGARVLRGEAPSDDTMPPLVLADTNPTMAALQADVFAPLLSLVRVDDEQQALALARQCPYALGASVFGGVRRARALAERIPAGVVVINDMIVPTADPRVPFGGRGESGFGVTRGAEGLLELTCTKAVLVRHGRWRPYWRRLAPGTEPVVSAYLRAAHGRSWIARLRALWQMLRAAGHPK